MCVFRTDIFIIFIVEKRLLLRRHGYFLNIPYVCDTITCADECLERARALSERIFSRDGMCACVRGGAARARPVRCLWTALSAFEP